ncbi:MAG: class I SAM-dependent methyltransferase [Geodermatophilaceae bacterium]
MSLGYTLAYATGITPWERAAEADAPGLDRLYGREEADHGGPGRMVDLGCGSGAHTVALAARGWKATGVDQVGAALRRARQRARSRQVTAEFVQADVTTLDPAQLGSGIDFFLDVGCFHGLSDPQRSAMGRSVTALAGPAATLLLLAFKAGAAPRPLPRGADTADLERAFPQWRIIDSEAAITDGMPKPLRRAAPTWYRLRYQP